MKASDVTQFENSLAAIMDETFNAENPQSRISFTTRLHNELIQRGIITDEGYSDTLFAEPNTASTNMTRAQSLALCFALVRTIVDSSSPENLADEDFVNLNIKSAASSIEGLANAGINTFETITFVFFGADD